MVAFCGAFPGCSGAFGECGERARKCTTRWLCWETAANASPPLNSLILGKIQRNFAQGAPPLALKPLISEDCSGEFPMEGTGTFLSQTVKPTAPTAKTFHRERGQSSGTHSPREEQAARCIGPSAIQDRLDCCWLLHGKEDRGQRTDPVGRCRPVAEESNSLRAQVEW